MTATVPASSPDLFPPEARSRWARWAARLDRWTSALEAPLARGLRDPRYNPFYHTGTLALWSLMLLALTGLYLTLFYHFGFQDTYDSIAVIHSNIVGRIMRSVHRYASDFFLLFSLLHAWRMWVQNRLRGPRVLAWVTGVALLAIALVVGVTGYWMLADDRAQWLHQALVQGWMRSARGQGWIVRWLVPHPGNGGWVYLVTLFFVHVGLAVLMGLFYWWHILRLNNRRWFPPRYWLLVLTAFWVLLGIIAPAGLRPMWDFERWPTTVPLDAWYLFLLPAWLRWGGWVAWGLAGAAFVVWAAWPWLWRTPQAEPVRLNPEACIGCTLCARDCPYRALEMVPRLGEGRGPKLVAQLNPDLCVGCGICVGSCPTDALTLDHPTLDELRARVRRAAQPEDGVAPRVTFVCHRHVLANPEVWTRPLRVDGPEGPRPVHPVAVPCVGDLHPDTVALAWQAGAAEVQIIGCPPDDCVNRWGNTWLAQRLERKRKPWLRVRWKTAPVRQDWVAPADLPTALRASLAAPAPAAMTPPDDETWRDLLTRPAAWKAALFLAVLTALVVALTRWPYAGPAWARQAATFEVAFSHRLGQPLTGEQDVVESPVGDAVAPQTATLTIQVDGESVWAETHQAEDGVVHFFAQWTAPPGRHQVVIRLQEPGHAWTLFAGEVEVAARQVRRWQFHDLRTHGDPEMGRRLFLEEVPGVNAGCRLCHSLEPDVRLVGPSLYDIGATAADRVPGLSAEEYLYQSIVEPDAYVVPGYPAGTMPPDARERLTEEQIQDLVAFLLTLTGEGEP